MIKTFTLSCLLLVAGIQPLFANSQEGVASWYGPGFHGRLTASGEVFNTMAMTAAHKTLKFGTRVLVENTDNGLTITVRINDRGPFIEGRIIDLSQIAAKHLGINGLANVRIRKID